MSIKNAVVRYFIHQNKFYNIASVLVRSNKHEWREEQREYRKYGKIATTGLFTSAVLGISIIGQAENKGKVANAKDKREEKSFEAGEKRSDLPTYTAEEVSKHNKTTDFWVTYKNGVYDMTSFLPSHPGGDQILNAAGFSIEPFWNVYGMHKTDDIFKLLETHRIGNLDENDIVDHSDDELWAREPRRDPRLIVKTPRPFNAETPAKYLVENFDTPNELFYVRQHMPVPDLDASKHRVMVVVEGRRKVHQFSLKDLDRFPKTTLRAALMCAGNRRIEMDKVKPVKGISWNAGAISNAVWSGVLLRDVLLYCGVDEHDLEGKHVILQGADIDATGTNFSTSIPLHMAMNPNNSILLATHMNGEPLPADHGRPLRAVVPGAPAVRSVKWLESITISKNESPSHWHQKDYRAFNPSKTWETADFSTAPPVYSLPVTSAICEPLDGDTVQVENGCVTVRGYAYSGGGAQILRVDVSADRGQSWSEATLVCRDSAPPQRHHAWTLWETKLSVTAAQREMELWVKATDSNFNTQPENFNDIWNIRGILSNAYHKIKVQLKH